MTTQVRDPRRSDARRNRERILVVARDAFATEGLGVPMREIARRADVGAATLYRHFPTKEALLGEAFAEQMASCGEIIAEGLAAADPGEGFRSAVERLMAVHALDRGFAMAFTSRTPRTAPFTDDRQRALRGMSELVRRAKLSGDLRHDVGLADVVLLLAANDGIRGGSPAQRLAASRRLGALMLQSLRVHPNVAPLPPPAHLPLAPRLPTH